MRRRSGNHPLHLTNHPTSQSQYAGREWCPFRVRPRWNGLGSSILLPDRSLRCQSVKNTRGRGGVNKRHIINTTSCDRLITRSTEHISNHIHLLHQRRVDTSKIILRASRNTQRYSPSTREESGASFMCAQGRKTDFGTPSSCPTMIYGIGD